MDNQGNIGRKTQGGDKQSKKIQHRKLRRWARQIPPIKPGVKPGVREWSAIPMFYKIIKHPPRY
jgi:hypothetical protein